MTPEQLFETNMNLVYFVAHNRASRYMIDTNIRDDMLQEGFLALWKACLNFDGSKGTAFSTYAVPSIEHNMINYAVRQNKKMSNLVSLQDPVLSSDDQLSYEQILCDPHLDSIEIGILSQIEESTTKIGKQADLIVQKIMEGYSQKEIGEMLGISQPTVSRIINKIRKDLKNGQ